MYLRSTISHGKLNNMNVSLYDVTFELVGKKYYLSWYTVMKCTVSLIVTKYINGNIGIAKRGMLVNP